MQIYCWLLSSAVLRSELDLNQPDWRIVNPTSADLMHANNCTATVSCECKTNYELLQQMQQSILLSDMYMLDRK